MRSVIIGGGVAGCALAAALRGLEVAREAVVLERRPLAAPAGMGFILMENGLEALAQIAPEFDWQHAGRSVDRVVLRSRAGRVFAEHALARCVCVSRERFLAQLRAAGDGTPVLEGQSFEGFDRDAGGRFRAALLQGANGPDRLEGDLFFGCDGANSRVRHAVFPEARLAEVTVSEIVSTCECPEVAARLGTSFHKFHDEEGGLAVGLLAESDSRLVWFVQFDAQRWPFARREPEALRAFVAERLEGWPAEVRAAIAATDFAKSHLWPTRDLPPLAALAQANLALVGDAAHACLPFTSQGANGALVDAALLAELLSEARAVEEAERAFARYTAMRRAHHRRLFIEGRRLRAEFLSPIAQSGPGIPLCA
jgi:2-polyprenyl-6-methoxyphenol hydroxylase-like FAD-dependent oxidoreductase